MLRRDSEILEELRGKGSRNALERRGEIVRVRGEKCSALEFTNQVAGRITVRPEGFGGQRSFRSRGVP